MSYFGTFANTHMAMFANGAVWLQVLVLCYVPIRLKNIQKYWTALSSRALTHTDWCITHGTVDGLFIRNHGWIFFFFSNRLFLNRLCCVYIFLKPTAYNLNYKKQMYIIIRWLTIMIILHTSYSNLCAWQITVLLKYSSFRKRRLWN